MNLKLQNLLISIGLTIVLGIILVILTNLAAEASTARRLLVMFGGELPGGYIQLFTFLLFFYGILETRRMITDANREQRSLSMQLLPEKENFVLGAEDVAKLKLQMIELEKREKFILVDLIKKACTKFRANKSVSETMEMLGAQSKINLQVMESEQSMIRYVGWAIPSVGFIGTVIGIAASLGVADRASSTDGIREMTTLLNIAFDTTLVSLVLSLILMYFYHLLQEKGEKLNAALEGYILENLVNRIYHRENN